MCTIVSEVKEIKQWSVNYMNAFSTPISIAIYKAKYKNGSSFGILVK